MLPVEIKSNFGGTPCKRNEVTKSLSFVTTMRFSRIANATISLSDVRFPGGKIQRVNRIVPGSGQFPRQTARQLRVHDEFHAATGSMLLMRLKRAA